MRRSRDLKLGRTSSYLITDFIMIFIIIYDIHHKSCSLENVLYLHNKVTSRIFFWVIKTYFFLQIKRLLVYHRVTAHVVKQHKLPVRSNELLKNVSE